MDATVTPCGAELTRLGTLEVNGVDARTFLHAQLTSDIAALAPDRARYAGWCSAKGRLLASLLVVPHGDGFLLGLSRDLAPAVARRLGLFVLRAKVSVADASADWVQFGLWGADAGQRVAALGASLPQRELDVRAGDSGLVIAIGAGRFLLMVPAERHGEVAAEVGPGSEQVWELDEIRAGRARVTQATQDLFVPQMLAYERLGAIDFKKGCYPGQEVVARTQYRGQLKRRLVRARTAGDAPPGAPVYSAALPGQPSGTVVNCAPSPQGGSELLAVLQNTALEDRAPLHLGAEGGEAIALLPLPDAA